MTGKHRLLAILAIIFVISFESGCALKCYECVGTREECSDKLKDEFVSECPSDSPTESTPVSTDSTSESTETSPSSTESTITEPEVTETPEKPDEPTEPGKPDVTESPEKPDEPTEPGKPDDPENPDKPDEPTEPGKPDDPENPDKPNEPTEPGKPDDPENPGKPNEPAKPPNADGSDNNNNEAGNSLFGGRQRRSVVDRFFRIHTQADGDYHCFEKIIKKDDKEIVNRGCTKNKNYCDDDKEDRVSCKVCQGDKCNSASSNFATASMLLPLIALVFVTK